MNMPTDPYPYRDCEKCGRRHNRHPTKHIEYTPSFACVDEDLADLVLACWRLGIDTDESCQDFEDDPAWDAYILQEGMEPRPKADERLVLLSFDDPDDYARFANIVSPLMEEEQLAEWTCRPVEGGWLASVVFPYKYRDNIVAVLEGNP